MGEPEDRLDARVEAALAVLRGEDVATVARRHDVATDLVERWVTMFRNAGAAALRNEPRGEERWARDRLLAAISHELRTPLAKVRAYLSLLEDDDPQGERDRAEVLERVHGTFVQLDHVLHHLVETTKASLGRIDLVRSHVRLSTLVAPYDGEVTTDCWVDVDTERMGLVLEDLLALANRGPRTTDVRVRASCDGDWAQLVVERRGDPFDPARLAAELDPFVPRTGHTDITFGLHLAMALTVLHGGHLGVRRDGDVDELWVRIPVQPPHDDDEA